MSHKKKKDINEFVLRYRWFIMIAMSIFVIFLEYFEHEEANGKLLGAGFLWEIIVFGVLMPVTGGLLLSLINDRYKMNAILARIDRQRTLKNALLSARDWDELITIISQIPHTIFPYLFGDALYIYYPEVGQYIQVSAWMSIQGKFPGLYPLELDAEAEIIDRISDSSLVNPEFKQHPISVSSLKVIAYSLPIFHQKTPLAIIRLLFLEDHPPAEEGLASLSELVVDIALAIQNFQYQSDFIFQTAAAQAERQRIARQLHDTLAQDLAFLRLKLEQLLYNEQSQIGEGIGNELYRLYKTADHSYEQVRNSLKSMRQERDIEFTSALYESATTIAENADFRVELVQEGSPAELSIEMQRKILYIMREVLRNIGKHAHANLTRINIHWDKDCIQIDTIDNGRGFDVERIFDEKSTYGLNIIEEVVTELQGRYDLQSSENDGTRFRFWFPISV